MGITALDKPRGVWCRHCTPGKGCGIYDARPDECRDFMCQWLLDSRLGPEWKPERSKLVICTAPDGKGIVVFCDPGFPAAWRSEPYRSGLREFARQAIARGSTLMVVSPVAGATLVTPDQEFFLGDFAADDRIVTETVGDRIVKAYIAARPSPAGTIAPGAV